MQELEIAGDQCSFLFPRPAFYLPFGPDCIVDVREFMRINNPDRAS